MTDRLQQISEAVARDSANLEDAYADRAWLLQEVTRLRNAASAVITARYDTAGLSAFAPGLVRALANLEVALSKIGE
jgi:hypothetical protein